MAPPYRTLGEPRPQVPLPRGQGGCRGGFWVAPPCARRALEGGVSGRPWQHLGPGPRVGHQREGSWPQPPPPLLSLSALWALRGLDWVLGLVQGRAQKGTGRQRVTPLSGLSPTARPTGLTRPRPCTCRAVTRRERACPGAAESRRKGPALSAGPADVEPRACTHACKPLWTGALLCPHPPACTRVVHTHVNGASG